MNPTSTPTPRPSGPGTLVPDIVQNIPMQVQAGAAPQAINEDDELDEIMHDVGKNLKEVINKPHKTGLFRRHQAPEPKTPANQTAQTQPKAQSSAAPKPVADKPAKAKANNTPVLVIMMTVIVTCGLIAAAYYAYK